MIIGNWEPVPKKVHFGYHYRKKKKKSRTRERELSFLLRASSEKSGGWIVLFVLSIQQLTAPERKQAILKRGRTPVERPGNNIHKTIYIRPGTCTVRNNQCRSVVQYSYIQLHTTDARYDREG